MKTKNLQLFFDKLISNIWKGMDLNGIFTAEFLPRQQIQTNWFAITGPPCAGKTTVLNILEKQDFPVISEKGRFVIEAALGAGFSTQEIFANQQLLQETILKAKIVAHLQKPPQRLTILEDGIPESLAYFRIENLDISEIANVFDLFRYQKIFYFDALPLLNDPARPHHQEKIDQLGEMKAQVYLEMGYEVIRIPVLPILERVELIRNYLDE